MYEERNRECLRMLRKLNLRISMILNARMAGMDMSASQGEVLVFLAEHRGSELHAFQICQDAGLSKAAVSALLKKLRSKGYIRYAVNSKDERCKDIVLTDEGEQFYQSWRQAVRGIVEAMYQNFSPEEKETLCRLLNKLYNNQQKLTENRRLAR